MIIFTNIIILKTFVDLPDLKLGQWYSLQLPCESLGVEKIQ